MYVMSAALEHVINNYHDPVDPVIGPSQYLGNRDVYQTSQTYAGICPFVYHYFMIFLKQRTFEIQLKAIKVHMVSIGISAQR